MEPEKVNDSPPEIQEEPVGKQNNAKNMSDRQVEDDEPPAVE